MIRHIPMTVLWTLVLVLFGGSVIPAQDSEETCPGIAQDAFANVDSLCGETGRNQVCYGNISLTAEPQPDTERFEFDEPGDITDVVTIRTLRLSEMDESVPEWGVALMKLQANLPDTLPGQNVTFLLFGDVEIENAVGNEPPPIFLEATAANTINVYSGPSTDYAVVTSLANAQTVTVDGRSEQGDWLRVQLAENQLGWVYAPLVTVEGDVTALTAFETDNLGTPTGAYTPMQAFYFKSGVGDALCRQAPHSGILVQTPKGVGEIELTINEVQIKLASTAYLQADTDDVMRVNLIEGLGKVTAFGVEQSVPAGARVDIPIDEQGLASGPPSLPEACSRGDVQALPVDENTDCNPSMVRIDPHWGLRHCQGITEGPTTVYFVSCVGVDLSSSEMETFRNSVAIDGQPGPGFSPVGPELMGSSVGFCWRTPTVSLSPGDHNLYFTQTDHGEISCPYTAQEP